MKPLETCHSYPKKAEVEKVYTHPMICRVSFIPGWYVSMNGKTPSCWVFNTYTASTPHFSAKALSSRESINRPSSKTESKVSQSWPPNAFHQRHKSTSKLGAWYDGEVLVAKSKHTEVAACIRFTGYMMHLKFQVACSLCIWQKWVPNGFFALFRRGTNALEPSSCTRNTSDPELTSPAKTLAPLVNREKNHEKTRSLKQVSSRISKFPQCTSLKYPSCLSQLKNHPYFWTKRIQLSVPAMASKHPFDDDLSSITWAKEKHHRTIFTSPTARSVLLLSELRYRQGCRLSSAKSKGSWRTNLRYICFLFFTCSPPKIAPWAQEFLTLGMGWYACKYWLRPSIFSKLRSMDATRLTSSWPSKFQTFHRWSEVTQGWRDEHSYSREHVGTFKKSTWQQFVP